MRLSARRLRGAILLRATSECDDAGFIGASMDDGDLAAARALVESAGGTLVTERSNGSASISVRLDPAPPIVANPRAESGVRRVAS